MYIYTTIMYISMEIPLKNWKKKKKLPYDPAIPLLGIYPKNMKTLIGNDIWAPMFIAALFTTAQMRKQPKGPLMGAGIKKMWMYT